VNPDRVSVRSTGFTLPELAIALVIIALLLAGAIIPLGTQIDVRNNADTQRTMDQIKEAVIGFALANGRLPCPADGTIAAGAANAGAEQCANSFGVVPWAALGVAETDAWGRRFSYTVSQTFTDAVGTTFNTAGQLPACNPTPTPLQSSFALCTLGNLTVNTRNDGTHAAVALGAALPAVIISHGKNGYGAYNTRGTLLPAPAAGTDEGANATHNAAASVFYSRTPTPGASGCGDTAAGSFCEFDDIVAMISAPILVGRMVSAGRLP
jgi:prepilin-type N-terminal cleavage/methylation domain-containing protein